ncbi:MAG TPA: hypothetical protein VF642_06635 [Propionibacteriaceae bacterium]
MRNTSRRAGRAAVTALCGAAVVGGLVPALTLTTPAAAATEKARVSVVAGGGAAYQGTRGRDVVIVTRAGTNAAPLLNFKGTAPLTVGAGCTPVAGDSTRALCTAPKDASGQLRGFTVSTGDGDDSVANATPNVPITASLGAGRDSVNGGAGNDLLSGSDGDDLLRGHGGDDTLHGSFGADTLDGGAGNDDDLFGGPDADILLGGLGDGDDLNGGTGADRMDGGAGQNDTLLYNDRTAAVSINLTQGTAGSAGESDVVVGGFEVAFGGTGNDTLTGGSGDDALFGGAGNDVIQGMRGADILVGDAGDDFLIAGPTQLFGGTEPNRDGAVDGLNGRQGQDSCLRSPSDVDRALECEQVISVD